MDARELEPDDPLPQTCQHCKWGEAYKPRLLAKPKVLCKCEARFYVPPHLLTKVTAVVESTIEEPDHTCKHWEERE